MCDRRSRLASAACVFALRLLACQRQSDTEAIAAQLLSPLRPAENAVVIDIGAGRGELAQVFARSLPDARIIATELREADVARITAERSTLWPSRYGVFELGYLPEPGRPSPTR